MQALGIITFVVGGLIIITMIIAMIGSIKHDMELSYKWDKIFREEDRND